MTRLGQRPRSELIGDVGELATRWRAVRWMVVRRSPSIDAGEAQFKARASIGWMVQTPPTGVSNNPRAFEQALSRSRAKAGICTTARAPRQWARPRTSGANKSPRGFCKPGGPFRHRGLVGLNLRRPTGLRAGLNGDSSRRRVSTGFGLPGRVVIHLQAPSSSKPQQHPPGRGTSYTLKPPGLGRGPSRTRSRDAAEKWMTDGGAGSDRGRA